jgi:hypothetical protein
MWHARMTEVLTFNMYTLYVLVLERSVFNHLFAVKEKKGEEVLFWR